MLNRISHSLHLVHLLQQEHVIFLAQRDCQPFPPGVKCSAFGVFMLFCDCGLFNDFLVYLSKFCPKMEELLLEKVTNLVDLVFLLQEKHLILVAEHDCQPFPTQYEN